MNNLLTMYQSTNTASKSITPDPKKRDALIKHLSKCLKLLKTEKNQREGSQRAILRDQLLTYAIPHHEINGVGNIDIAIKHKDGNVGVIIEYKRPVNQLEMMHPDNLNAKGFQELIQYYLGQITGYHNTDRKQAPRNTDRIIGIVTNGFSWYIINNKNLYNFFGKRKTLKKNYIKWAKGQAGSTSTKYLRETFIAKVIDKALKHGIKIGHFNLNKMMVHKGSTTLASGYQNRFYRFLSPQNLLYENVFTDSNELKPAFYNELLYLMGLKERKKSKSKVITRDKNQNYTLVNNILDRLSGRYPNLSSDQLNDISIQLTVTWMNRFLFLKLLEAQLVSFNGNDDSYKFLTNQNLGNFNQVYDLFFRVLAVRPSNRVNDLQKRYSKIPYLNSSLFEQTYLERKYLNINDLDDNPVDIYKKTKVKGYKKGYKVPILMYILDFLDSYNFSTSSIRKDNSHNDLINASVLGLIFEKINGYKDGAYFTPGWICQFMANHAVRSAVINNVNKALNKNYSSLNNIKFFIFNSDDPMNVAKQVNAVINSIRVCDPSVGSGHFLVSVLNELIAIKSYLGILIDANGNPASFRCRISNDELVTLLSNGQRYYYHRNDKLHTVIQKTLFNEKRYLIENCLFGVDINPNSVEICHLRLWIELLKNAYYYSDNNGNEHLTTMPNIDINIKAKNSLVHMYSLKSKGGLSRTQFNRYRQLVDQYKNSDNKATEHITLAHIQLLRNSFNSAIYTPDRAKYIRRLRSDYRNVSKYRQPTINESETKIQKADRIINLDNAKKKLNKDHASYASASKVDPFYTNEHSMEWRSAFPEVLSSTERYVGFDLIIGNPPYVFARNNSFNADEKLYYKDHYNLAKYQLNTYHMFIELAYRLLKKNGTFAYIVPNNILTINSNLALRKFLLNHAHNLILINSKDKLFQGANVDNAIIFFTKAKPNNVTLIEMKHHDLKKIGTVADSFFGNNDTEPIFSISRVGNQSLMPIYNRMLKCTKLGNIAEVDTGIKVYQTGKGLGHGKGGKQSSKDKTNRIYHASKQLTPEYDKYLSGADVQRYHIDWGYKSPKETWVKYGKNVAEMRQPRYFKGPRLLVRQIVSRYPHSIIGSYISKNNVINDINSMIIRNSKVNLLFILGVINSSIETIWFAMKFDKFQRKTFPQFKINELNQFPIPKANQKQINHLVSLVKYIMNAVNNHNKDRIRHYNISIDNYVMNLYGLSDPEKEKVKNFKL